MYGAYNDEYDEMMTDHMQKSNSQRGGAGRVGHSLWIQTVSALAPPDQSTQLTHSPHLTLLPAGPVGQVWWALLTPLLSQWIQREAPVSSWERSSRTKNTGPNGAQRLVMDSMPTAASPHADKHEVMRSATTTMGLAVSSSFQLAMSRCNA